MYVGESVAVTTFAVLVGKKTFAFVPHIYGMPAFGGDVSSSVGFRLDRHFSPFHSVRTERALSFSYGIFSS